jgi:hypothetical protein
MNDESLFAFARSQGMDESSLALIFQHTGKEMRWARMSIQQENPPKDLKQKKRVQKL